MVSPRYNGPNEFLAGKVHFWSLNHKVIQHPPLSKASANRTCSGLEDGLVLREFVHLYVIYVIGQLNRWSII